MRDRHGTCNVYRMSATHDHVYGPHYLGVKTPGNAVIREATTWSACVICHEPEPTDEQSSPAETGA